MNLSVNFKGLPGQVEIRLVCLQNINSMIFKFTWRQMSLAAYPRIRSREKNEHKPTLTHKRKKINLKWTKEKKKNNGI